VTRTPFSRSTVEVTRQLWLAVLAGQHGHRVSDQSICVYDVYRVTTCRPGRDHIAAASRLQLVLFILITLFVSLLPLTLVNRAYRYCGLCECKYKLEGHSVEFMPPPSPNSTRGYTLEVFHVHSYQDQFIQPVWAECVLFV